MSTHGQLSGNLSAEPPVRAGVVTALTRLPESSGELRIKGGGDGEESDGINLHAPDMASPIVAKIAEDEIYEDVAD
eukprot:10696816-Heterocapsa_arctica.AAC.1